MIASDNEISYEHWEPGDDAVCIKDFGIDSCPKKGCLYKVERVVRHPFDPRVTGLTFAAWHREAWNAVCFVKVTPDEALVERKEEFAL